MADEYFSREDASMRLNETICMWKGEPVYVHFRVNSESHTAVAIKDFHKRTREQIVEYTNDDFVYEAFPLGYMSTSLHEAVYLTRVPERRQKQGLCKNSINASNGLMPVRDRWWKTKEFYNCIMGIHTKAPKAIQLMNEGIPGIVVGRHVAFRYVDHDVYSLVYRERVVGTYSPSIGVSNLISTPATSVFINVMEDLGLDMFIRSNV